MDKKSFLYYLGSSFLLSQQVTMASSFESSLMIAKDAFMIQSGFQELQNNLTSYIEEETKKTCNNLGIRTEVDTLVFAYHLYNTKTISIPYKNYRITYTYPDSVQATLSWNIPKNL